jgi:hypothetical protein
MDVSMFDFKQDAERQTKMEKEYSMTDHFERILFTGLRMAFMTILISINFLALSISLNCNKNETPTKKFFSAIFAFFFGLVYLIVNFYIYRVLTMKKICDINEDFLFPI